jgi:Glycosyltransferase family 92
MQIARARYLSIGAIFKDEAEYLREWIEFHRLVGVEHFYLYDNESADDPERILAPYVDSGLVTLYQAPGAVPQMQAYAHCAATHATHTRWIAFLDMDEFLFPTEPIDLHSILADYETCAAVVVNWVSFGSSGLIDRPAGGVLDAFQDRGALDHVVPYPHLALPGGGYRPLNTHIKSIVDPRRVVGCDNPHFLHYASTDCAVDEQGRKVRGAFSETVSVERLRLNHYWSKSRSEFARKLAKGRADSTSRRSWEEFDLRDGLCTGVQDELIVRYLPELDRSLDAPRLTSLSA